MRAAFSTKSLLIALSALLSGVPAGFLQAADPPTAHLAAKQDAFFVENDLVYSRLLQLARDGSYRQINRSGSASAEVDRGTWEQSADGTVLLHFTRGALRFHALLSGPLSLTLDTPEKAAALPAAADGIRRWLAQGNDVAFAPTSVREIALAPLVLTMDPAAESVRRSDLEALARQIDEVVWSEQHRTFCLVPCRAPDAPLLLVLPGAVFQPADITRVRRDYPSARGQPPPFYFAQVDAGTFAREAGSWQEMH